MKDKPKSRDRIDSTPTISREELDRTAAKAICDQARSQGWNQTPAEEMTLV